MTGGVVPLVACAWAGLAAAVWRRATGGPAPASVSRRLAGLGARRAVRPGPVRVDALVDRAGTLVVSAVSVALGRRLAPAPPLRRRAGWAVIVGAVGALIVPWGAPGAVLVTWCAGMWVSRRAEARRSRAVLRALPEAVDLLVLGIEAGANVLVALAALARRGPDPIAADVDRALREVDQGRRLADALEDLPSRLGEPVRPLVAALVASERYGAPLGDGLVRLAAEVRALRRRRAEEAARRVPVKLLFPLVTCTLPAFALLTVAPLVAGALGAVGR